MCSIARFMIVLLLWAAGDAAWVYVTKFNVNQVINEASYSPDTSKISVATDSNSHYVYSTGSYSLLHTYAAGSKALTTKFSPDQNYIAFGLQNNSVTLLNANTYAPINSISTLFSEVYEVDFSSDSSKILICGIGTNSKVGY